jgi:hypothetical protein
MVVLRERAHCEVRAELETSILKVIRFNDLSQCKELIAVCFLNRWL